MNMLTEPLRHHHKHCDDLFVAAEAAAAASNWPQCQVLLSHLGDAIEDHFRTEEAILFPAFEAATGMAGGPTQMMRSEHARMRELLGQMRSAQTIQAGDAFAGAAETLLVFMQQHNLKEENILYPMCDRSLAAQSEGLAARLHESLVPRCPTKN